MRTKRDDVPEQVWTTIDLDSLLGGDFHAEHPVEAMNLRMLVETAIRAAAPIIRADEEGRVRTQVAEELAELRESLRSLREVNQFRL